MKKWKYRTITRISLLTDDELDKYGGLGYELVNFVIEDKQAYSAITSTTKVRRYYHYFFKREE